MIENSIVLIEITRKDRSEFGTGFIFYQDRESTYILTCAHVVKDFREADSIKVDGIIAEVATFGGDNGIDLAILKLSCLYKMPMSLCSFSEKRAILIAGFYNYGNETIILRQIKGSLGEKTKELSLDRKFYVDCWDLLIEGENYLREGYSGSPVIDRATGHVLAIVCQSIDSGEKGIAIAIDALNIFWQEYPPGLVDPILDSGEGVDYTTLLNLLKVDKWKDANDETRRIVKRIASPNLADIKTTDLHTIDRLWVKYSNGLFGFSVQKEIFIKVSNDLGSFWDEVGWKSRFSFLSQANLDEMLIFSLDAPKGHLPFIIDGLRTPVLIAAPSLFSPLHAPIWIYSIGRIFEDSKQLSSLFLHNDL